MAFYSYLAGKRVEIHSELFGKQQQIYFIKQNVDRLTEIISTLKY